MHLAVFLDPLEQPQLARFTIYDYCDPRQQVNPIFIAQALTNTGILVFQIVDDLSNRTAGDVDGFLTSSDGLHSRRYKNFRHYQSIQSD